MPYAPILLFLMAASGWAAAQKKISCPDGEHLEIDVKQIVIKYEASSFAGTLTGLSMLGTQFEVAPKKLQEAAVATQQWDVFLKGLAAGYNTCAVTRQQYADGLTRIYPRLKEDAASLEEIRKIISDGQKADEKRLQRLVESYYNNLRAFAQISGKEIILERIEAVSEQIASGQAQILEQQKAGTDAILARLNELEQREANAPVHTPAEVAEEIGEFRKTSLAKADEAEAAYNKGYDLLNRYRFQESIPYLQQAASAVPLPDVYLALQDAQGNLYGTTAHGGAFGGGTIFKLNNRGQNTVLYNFPPGGDQKRKDGTDHTEAGLSQEAAGNRYGTTHGGSSDRGTVFEPANGGEDDVSITLTSNVNPSFVKQPVIFSAVVSGSGATPTGSVTFEEGTTALGTVMLANGRASLASASTKGGSVSIVANYSGDKSYEATNSKPLTQTVNQYTTSTALTSTLNRSTYGQPVTLTATVTSAGPTPIGAVWFQMGTFWDATLVGVSGVAKITTSFFPVGASTITARYEGDAAHAESTSPALALVVDKATSTTTIVSSVNPSNAQQTVKLTATVTSPTATPTGTVKFMDGSTALGTGTLTKGNTSYITSAISAGSHNITAVYEGTANFGGSTSPVLVQTVN